MSFGSRYLHIRHYSTSPFVLQADICGSADEDVHIKIEIASGDDPSLSAAFAQQCDVVPALTGSTWRRKAPLVRIAVGDPL